MSDRPDPNASPEEEVPSTPATPTPAAEAEVNVSDIDAAFAEQQEATADDQAPAPEVTLEKFRRWGDEEEEEKS